MSDNLSSNKRIARNTLLLYIRMGFVLMISLYTTRVILKILGVSDFGVYNIVGGFVSMFAVLSTTMSIGINRFFNCEIGQKSESGVTRVYNVALVMQFILAIITFVLVEGVGLWYLRTKMVIPLERMNVAQLVFQFSIISLLFSIMQIPYSAAIMAYERMDYYAIVSIVFTFLKLGAVILLQFTRSDKLLFYGIAMTIISGLNFLMYFIYCKKVFKEFKLQRHIDKSLLKSMFSFSGWMMLDPVAYTVRGQGCNLTLNSFFGPIVNAAFGISNQIADALNSFVIAISIAFRPQLMQSFSAGEYGRTNNLMFSMSKIMFMLLLMVAIPVIFEINYILHQWLGNFPSYTVSFTCFILIIKTIDTLNSPITAVIMATNEIRKYMIASSIIVSSILPITLVCLKLGCNPISMYIPLLILTILNQIVSVYLLNEVYPQFSIHKYITNVIFPCLNQALVVIILPLMISLFLKSTFIRLFLICTASFLVSCFAAYKFNLNSKEREITVSFVRKLVRR